jgi:hypothetical protein
MKKCIVLALTILLSNANFSQCVDPFGKPCDYIYQVGQLPTFTFRVFKNNRSKNHYYKLVAKVRKVYPYAQIAGQRLLECENQLAAMSAEQRSVNSKKYYKLVEDQIKAEFDKDMRRLTISEGQLLIKLIDRECSRTGYSLVKDLRNGFTAWGYQQFARICGTNLKKSYDPYDEDEDIEEIIQIYC